MKKIALLSLLVFSLSLSCQTLKGLKDKVKTVTTTKPKLSNEEVVKGLKEALSVGTNNSSSMASKLDGFNKNPLIYIPWPPEAQEMKTKLTQLGFSKKIEEFEISLNRAAEEAALKAAPIFVDAVTNMSVQDGFAILNGADTAATNYLRKSTYSSLSAQFMPVVKAAIEKVKVTSYWQPLVTAYNKIPMVKKQNPNLDEYVNNKAINGLMLLIANEEIKIRRDPAARVSDLLKKVFGK
ncbi:MAG TPA: DUF4197 domain-containing protein [Bacteroidia bacterium]|nr:DUF4197 domain-containing protein [Bacteroidia bacterium]